MTISRTLVEILRRRIDGKRPGDLVFPAPDGGPWNANNLRNRYWRTALAAASRCEEHPPVKVKCGRGGKSEKIDPLSVSTCACKTRLHQKPRIHDTRHSHVGWLIDAGWDLYAIQQRIGHESIKTTFDVYGHRLSHGDTAKLDALDTMLDRRRTKKYRSSGDQRRTACTALHSAHRHGPPYADRTGIQAFGTKRSWIQNPAPPHRHPDREVQINSAEPGGVVLPLEIESRSR